ncbi:MAG: hypothetical protein NZO16_04805, partial [Deltaproteobacteria bacterium]|nr:hypothetical protein [Deltaproteobacteria bacterium]
ARNGKMNKLKFIRLFVHGLVHLSGLDHEEITQKEHFFLVEANILGDITEKFLDKIRKNSEF